MPHTRSARFAIVMVFVGCCSNVVFLEHIVREVPSSGNLITFAQFLFIAIEGFIYTMKFGKVRPKIPISTYVVMVALFFSVQVANNMAFTFDVPMILHMIIRSGSLLANLVLGVILLKKRYGRSKYLSAIMITAGIIIATFGSANNIEDRYRNVNGKEPEVLALSNCSNGIGVMLLSFAMFTSARMGIYQEMVYKKHGKHTSEALFFNHALPLPGFLFMANNIYSQGILLNQSAPVHVPGLSLSVPVLWLHLVANVISQYVCIRSVFVLTSECSSLTVTLLVTLRKFTSLVFSIFYFGNSFTLQHWLATVLVFGGTLIFTETIPKVRRALWPTKDELDESILLQAEQDEEDERVEEEERIEEERIQLQNKRKKLK